MSGRKVIQSMSPLELFLRGPMAQSALGGALASAMGDIRMLVELLGDIHRRVCRIENLLINELLTDDTEDNTDVE
jgi:hypothetical protein